MVIVNSGSKAAVFLVFRQFTSECNIDYTRL